MTDFSEYCRTSTDGSQEEHYHSSKALGLALQCIFDQHALEDVISNPPNR